MAAALHKSTGAVILAVAILQASALPGAAGGHGGIAEAAQGGEACTAHGSGCLAAPPTTAPPDAARRGVALIQTRSLGGRATLVEEQAVSRPEPAAMSGEAAWEDQEAAETTTNSTPDKGEPTGVEGGWREEDTAVLEDYKDADEKYKSSEERQKGHDQNFQDDDDDGDKSTTTTSLRPQDGASAAATKRPPASTTTTTRASTSTTRVAGSTSSRTSIAKRAHTNKQDDEDDENDGGKNHDKRHLPSGRTSHKKSPADDDDDDIASSVSTRRRHPPVAGSTTSSTSAAKWRRKIRHTKAAGGATTQTQTSSSPSSTPSTTVQPDDETSSTPTTGRPEGTAEGGTATRTETSWWPSSTPRSTEEETTTEQRESTEPETTGGMTTTEDDPVDSDFDLLGSNETQNQSDADFIEDGDDTAGSAATTRPSASTSTTRVAASTSSSTRAHKWAHTEGGGKEKDGLNKVNFKDTYYKIADKINRPPEKDKKDDSKSRKRHDPRSSTGKAETHPSITNTNHSRQSNKLNWPTIPWRPWRAASTTSVWRNASFTPANTTTPPARANTTRPPVAGNTSSNTSIAEQPDRDKWQAWREWLNNQRDLPENLKTWKADIEQPGPQTTGCENSLKNLW